MPSRSLNLGFLISIGQSKNGSSEVSFQGSGALTGDTTKMGSGENNENRYGWHDETSIKMKVRVMILTRLLYSVLTFS